MMTWWLTKVSTTKSARAEHPSTSCQSQDRQDFLRLTVETPDGVGRSVAVTGGEGGAEGIVTLLEDAVGAIRDGGQLLHGVPSFELETPVPTVNRDDLLSLSWLQQLGNEDEHLDYTVSVSSGEHFTCSRHDSWTRQGMCWRTLSRVPAGAAVAPGVQLPRYDANCLLFSPWVLSQLCLPDLLAAVLGPGPSRYPQGVTFDPAWGGGVDLEGVDRKLTVFIFNGSRLTLATGRRGSEGSRSTGHAGIADPYVRDLIVTDTSREAQFPSDAAIVEAASTLVPWTTDQPGLVGLRLCRSQEGTHTTLIAEVSHPSAMLDMGLWCGPYQRGLGQWTSRWLAIPADALSVVAGSHTEGRFARRSASAVRHRTRGG